MSPDDGFIDLRLNRQEGQADEGFWPSFTDIMTVIVMIFMIAMVVLLLRNIELVNQLRATMAAERAAMELAKTTGEEKESLALKLISAENEISMMRIRLMQLDEKRLAQETTIGSQSDTISRLKSEKESLILLRDQLSAEKFTLTRRLEKAETNLRSQKQDMDYLQQSLEVKQQELASSLKQLASIQDELSNLESQKQSLAMQLASLIDRFGVQSQELEEARLAESAAGQAMSTLQSQYDNLKIKYDKLVRPARSPEGRYLVDVRYSKLGGKPLIEIKTQDEQAFRKVNTETLNKRLSALKASKSKGLYIKVIFPEESGLTFNEAWKFTAQLHNRYDYYYQGSGPGLVPLAVPVE